MKNPAVFSDPQVIPQLLVPPRGRGRPTLYSPELIEEFCGLLVDGLTVSQACKQIGIARRIIFDWKKIHPEFKAMYENAITFRNQCLMDDCVDIADDTRGANIKARKLRIDARWKQLRGMALKQLRNPEARPRSRSARQQTDKENAPLNQGSEWRHR
jgi:Bacteriophage Sf6, terminase small subunit-like